MKVVLLIDEFASCVVGGLSQIDRITLSLIELHSSASPSILRLNKSDSPEKLIDFLAGETAPVLIVKTSLLLGRRALQTLQDALTLRPQELRVLAWQSLADFFEQRVRERSNDNAVYWALIRQKTDLPALEKRLFQSLGKPTDGFVSKHLNRHVSHCISRLLARWPVRPGHCTLAGLLCILVFSAILATGTLWGFILGTLFYHLATVLDGCDGEIARVKFLESKFGERMDTMVDQLSNHLFVISLAIGLFRQPGISRDTAIIYLWEGMLSAALMAGTVWTIARFTKQRTGKDHYSEFGMSFVDESGATGSLRKVLCFFNHLLRRDSYALIFILFPLIGKPSWILHLFALGILVHVIVLSIRLATGKRLFVTTPVENAGE